MVIMKKNNASVFSQVPDSLLDLVADCFQALSDPTRLKILRALRNGPMMVHDLVALFTWTQPNSWFTDDHIDRKALIQS